MTHTTAQPAYHASYRGTDYAERVQGEAERQALINGDPAEALRRRNAGIDLAKKQRRGELSPVPAWLIRDLGSRDTIGNMVKARELSVQHGMTALMLREHTEGVTISVSGGGEFGVYVDGSQDAGLEGWCDKRRHGVQAWRLAMEATEPKARKAVERVVNGLAGTKQARRLIGGADVKAHASLKANLQRALDAASAYLGASA